jgi:transposase-like protein
VIPFFAYPPELQRIIDTANAIESLNSKLRRAVRGRHQVAVSGVASGQAWLEDAAT